ncbi:MAG: maleylacetate reductase [Burkholderiaceae bacterium]
MAAPARRVRSRPALQPAGRAGSLGARRALVLCTPEQAALAAQVAGQLGTRCAGVFDKAVMHVPIEIAHQARELATRLGADCCVAIGGGSTIGLGKAIALTSGLPVLAVPTTFAGSEMTAVWGLTEAGVKKTGRDPRVLPRTVIYDVQLLATLPAAIAVPSGINAIAHCVEALYAVDGNPVIALIAEEGIRALAASLPSIGAASGAPIPEAVLGQAFYGAWLAGMSLNGSSMALHHKLCHTLGGTLNLPHAQTHTVVLPHAVAYNQSHAPDAMRRISRALGEYGSQGAARGLFRLAKAAGAPTSLAELGVSRAALPGIADLAVSNAYPNPRPIEREALLALLGQALEGIEPAAA